MPGIMDEKDGCVDEEAHVLTMKHPIEHADNHSGTDKADLLATMLLVLCSLRLSVGTTCRASRLVWSCTRAATTALGFPTSSRSIPSWTSLGELVLCAKDDT